MAKATMTVMQMIERTGDLIDAAGATVNLPCDHRRDQQASCLYLEIEHDDRGVMRPGAYAQPIPGERVQRLCPSCRAYYLLQMARNALVEYARTR